VFGLALRTVCCPFPRKDCAVCLLRDKCVWSYVFDTPRPAGVTIAGKTDTIPHPFIIDIPRDEHTRYSVGDELRFDLILIGRAVECLPYFILAFEEIGMRGLGPHRGKFAVSDVLQGTERLYDAGAHAIVANVRREVVPAPATGETAHIARLAFLTPVRIVRDGRLACRPSFDLLIRSILRRLWLLSSFHDQPIEMAHKTLIEEAASARLVSSMLKRVGLRRYSRRQDSVIETDGVVGNITYEGDLTQFLPLLRAGELLHVGKGTSFGMGKYLLEVE
jgi:hypothetical protein